MTTGHIKGKEEVADRTNKLFINIFREEVVKRLLTPNHFLKCTGKRCLGQTLANAQAFPEIMIKLNVVKPMKPDGSYLKILN